MEICGNDKKKSFIKTSIVALVIFIFPFLTNAAEIYRWTDDDGVIHVTDDSTKIPAKYWEQERVKKEVIKPSTSEAPPAQPLKPDEETQKADTVELYGDHPADWWNQRFGELNAEIADTGQKLVSEKSMVSIFERGRGYGQIYSKGEISQYENYKADIPVTEERLKKLNEELEELQRKARLYGVPQNISK